MNPGRIIQDRPRAFTRIRAPGRLVGLILLLLAGLAAAPGIIYFQRTACRPELWPTVITQPIAYALIVSGVLGVFNGALIAFRQPHNRIGLLCGITGGTGLLTALANRYTLCGIYGTDRLPVVELVAWLSFILGPIIIALIFWQIPFWFPYGEYLSRRWRLFAGAAWSVFLTCLVVLGVLRGEFLNNGAGMVYPVHNPFGLPLPGEALLRAWLPGVLVAMLILISAAANFSLALRLKRARGDERKQIQWFTFFIIIVVSHFLCIEVIVQVFRPDLAKSLVYTAGFTLAWVGFPVMIGISVLKYRLYDIDIVIRRTLSYTALSLLLGLVFLVSITLLQLVFAWFSGQDSQAAIAISTLITAALFSPMRRGIQNSIDRRFYRNKYDTALTIERFSATVRNEVELEALLKSFETVIDETLQPELISVWLTPVRPGG